MNRSLREQRRAALAFPIALAVCLAVSAIAGAQGLLEITVVIESFQRLAMLEPSVAGDVWMNDAANSDWQRLIADLDDASESGALWFVHTIPFAALHTDGMPYGSLYSPWLGILLVFELDENATIITGLTLQYVAEPILAGVDPIDLAIALAESITAGAEAFEVLVGTSLQLDTGRDTRSTLKTRVDEHAGSLQPIYAADIAISQFIVAVLDTLVSGRFPDPLSLVRGEDAEWFMQLAPVAWTQEPESAVVVLASSGWAYQLLWLEITDNGAVSSASLIRLFDSVTTRGGDV
ncbi:hypothetical protein KKG90_11485 [Candidatus Bipolaricaulota bacterium]|nr:hypothetical protein [Candidatus Bipolaricaulota bacterium]